eukprot:XP_011673353.1 PREDICTED: alpha-1A adrenergic receptor-like [Strongylocentrotus purpuratus]
MLRASSHIVALTADRFIAVTKPLRYASLVTYRRIAIVLGCLWLLSIFLVVNPIIYGFRDRAFRKAFQNILRQF